MTASSTPTDRRMPRWLSRSWKWLLALAVLLLVGAGLYFGRPDPPPAQRGSGGRGGGMGNRPLPVVAEPAKTADVNLYLSALGTITAQNAVTVRTRVDGQLMRVHFREGQNVRAGDLLAEIDPRPFQVQLTQAEGQMARDVAQLRNAKIDLERYRTLFAQDSIEKQRLDTQEALVRQYEGSIKANQGQVDNARLQLTYSRVTAPASGRLGLRQVDPGNVVRASDANGLVMITQVRPINVVFTIPEDNLSAVVRRLREGAKLPVEAYDRDGKTKLATGVLVTMDNQIDTSTGTIKLKAQFANDDESLFPNQFVNVRMLLDTQRGATVIPSAAVQRGAPGMFVYVVKEDQSVAVRTVKLGPVDGQNVAIESGVASGEIVVVDGADKLREGGKVEVVSRDAQAVPAARPAGRLPREGEGKPWQGRRGEGTGEGGKRWQGKRSESGGEGAKP